MDKNKKSMLMGFIIGTIMIVFSYFVPNYFIPQQVEEIERRRLVACSVVNDYNSLKREVDADSLAFATIYGAAKEVAATGVQFLTAAQIQDRLQVAGKSARRTSPLNVRVSRLGGAEENGALVSWLRPGLSFEVFSISLQGPLADVIDYIDQELEHRPPPGVASANVDLGFQFCVLTSATVTRGQGGDWPSYQVTIWIPVAI